MKRLFFACLVVLCGCSKIDLSKNLNLDNRLDKLPAAIGVVATLAIKKITNNAIFGTATGIPASSTVEVVNDEGNVMPLGALTFNLSAGGTFSLSGSGISQLSGQLVKLRVKSSTGALVVETPETELPDIVGEPLPYSLGTFSKNFFRPNNYLQILDSTESSLCLVIIDDRGVVLNLPNAQGAPTCFSIGSDLERLINNNELVSPLDVERKYSVCSQENGIARCTPLQYLSNITVIPLENNRAELDNSNQKFIIPLTASASMCLQIINDSETYIVLNAPTPPYNCVGTTINGYLRQEIPLNLLTSSIDANKKYSVCGIDTRGVNYNVCSPLTTLTIR